MAEYIRFTFRLTLTDDGQEVLNYQKVADQPVREGSGKTAASMKRNCVDAAIRKLQAYRATLPPGGR